MRNKSETKKVEDAIHSIGLMNNLTDKQVKDIVESQFRFTYETIKGLDIEKLTEEEIDNLKTNFYYKYLGKLYTNSEVIRRMKLREEHIIRKINERDREL